MVALAAWAALASAWWIAPATALRAGGPYLSTPLEDEGETGLAETTKVTAPAEAAAPPQPSLNSIKKKMRRQKRKAKQARLAAARAAGVDVDGAAQTRRVTFEEEDSDEDLFLNSAFATHKAKRIIDQDSDDDDGKPDDADDDPYYHIKAGAVRMMGQYYQLGSKELAKKVAIRSATTTLPPTTPPPPALEVEKEEEKEEEEEDEGEEEEKSSSEEDEEHEDEEDEMDEEDETLDESIPDATASSASTAGSDESSLGYRLPPEPAVRVERLEKPARAVVPSQRKAASAFVPSEVTTKTFGEYGTDRYRRFFKHTTLGPISPWHDIPLSPDPSSPDTFLMVTEIPMMTQEQQSMATTERMNPIMVKSKDGEVVNYGQPMFWNYGFLPQTWADPDTADPETRLPGSDGPIGVIEVGSREHTPGEVAQVKVLGAIPMLDRGAMHWKMIVVEVNDPVASQLKPADAAEMWEPELVHAIREWFGSFEIFDGMVLDLVSQEKALEAVRSAHAAWERLRQGDAARAKFLWTGAGARRQEDHQYRYEGRARERRHRDRASHMPRRPPPGFARSLAAERSYGPDDRGYSGRKQDRKASGYKNRRDVLRKLLEGARGGAGAQAYEEEEDEELPEWA